MKEITINELKKIALSILIDVSKFCDNNGLTYYLCGGTLLGAIRHHGFIPWDDDIDIYMPRNDYEKFLNLYKSNDYKVFCWKMQKDYYLPSAKVIDCRTCLFETKCKSVENIGVFIDIFPLDGLSNNINISKKILTKNAQKMRLNMFTIMTIDTFLKKTLQFFVKMIFSSRFLCKQIEKQSRKYDFENSEYVGVAFGYYGSREIMPKYIFESTTKVEFEGKLFSAPLHYDEYLTRLYGNYMELPSKDKQITHHSFKAYWK